MLPAVSTDPARSDCPTTESKPGDSLLNPVQSTAGQVQEDKDSKSETKKDKTPVLWRIDRFLEVWLAPILVGIACLVVAENSEHDQKLRWLEGLERLVLALVAAFSTFNYQKTLNKLKNWTLVRNAYLLNLLTAANAILFGLVIYFSTPTVRLTGIVLIYAVFVLANLLQIYRSLDHCSDRKKRSALVLEGSTFLRQENAPTLIAYTLAVVLVAVAARFLPVDEAFLKVFVGGIAAFHLGLSVFQYSIAIRPNDPVEVVLEKSEWSEEAYNRVAEIPKSSRGWCYLLAICSVVAVGAMVTDVWRIIVPGPSVVLEAPIVHMPKRPVK